MGKGYVVMRIATMINIPFWIGFAVLLAFHQIIAAFAYGTGILVSLVAIIIYLDRDKS